MINLKKNRIYISNDKHATLVRVAGWLPDKRTLVWQLVEPIERYISTFHTKIYFKKIKGDYYFHPHPMDTFEKDFTAATRETILPRIKGRE